MDFGVNLATEKRLLLRLTDYDRQTVARLVTVFGSLENLIMWGLDHELPAAQTLAGLVGEIEQNEGCRD